MQVLRSYSHYPQDLKSCVLAIGNFDGIHRGHRAVLDEAKGIAAQHNVPCVVMTFHPHPKRFFAPDNAPLAIEPRHLKLRRLRALGMDAVLTLHFNAAFAAISASDFVEHILVGALGVTHVVVGEDFHFGHKREGDIHYLQQSAITHQFGFTYVPPVTLEDQHISSSRIRATISEGNMRDAATMLGRPYQLFGRIIHGDKRGRELGTPTANLRINHLHQPAYGVYAVELAVVKSPDCATHPPHWQYGVANIGVRPTFGNNSPVLEVHAFEPLGDVYGHYMRVRLIEHIRPEQQFDSVEQLKAQIGKDVAAAQTILNDYEAIKATA